MPDFLSLPPAERFVLIMAGMWKAVAESGGRQRPRGLAALAGPFVRLVWERLRRIAVRFTAAAARHALNPHPAPPRPKPTPEPGITSAAKQSRSRPKPPLPRKKKWLLRLIPETAVFASQLSHFLASPDVVALLADAPQLGRILRPLCQMLGIHPNQARCLYPQPLPAPAPPPPDAAPDAPTIPSQAAKQAAEAAPPPIAIPPATPPPLIPPPPDHLRTPIMFRLRNQTHYVRSLSLPYF